MEQPQPCHLLQLPPELRNCIYRLALATRLRKGHIIATDPSFRSHLPPLLRTCSQINQEASSIYCAEAQFVYLSTRALLHVLDTFRPELRRALKQLQCYDSMDVGPPTTWSFPATAPGLKSPSSTNSSASARSSQLGASTSTATAPSNFMKRLVSQS